MRERMLHLVKAVSETVLATHIDAGAHATLHDEGLLYRIEIANEADSTQLLRQIWIERANFDVVKEAVFSAKGNPIVTVEFKDYRALGENRNLQYPFHMAIHDIATDSHYTLKFREVIPNPPFSPTEFDALQS